jgi:hypothetical protein
MPTQPEIDALKQKFGTSYKINVAGIAADAVTLSNLVTSATPPSATSIYSTSISTFSTSLIDELEQFDFDSIEEDSNIRDRSIEQNVDEAGKYVQACSALRSEYIGLAKLFLDTRLKSEEFFRLDTIHQQEVAAGLYSLPYDEASDDVSSLQATLAESALQKDVIDTMYNASAPSPTAPKYTGALSKTQVDAYTDQAGSVALLAATQNGPAIQTGTTQLSVYRSKIEDASWQYSLRANTANTAQLGGRLSTAQRKQQYLQKDIGFRSTRAAVSRQLAYVQLGENIRPNAPLNYSERLTPTQRLFDLSLRKLIQRVLPLRKGLKEIYGINVSWASPQRGQILDEVGRWLILAQDELGKFHRRQRVSIFTVWLSQSLLRQNRKFPDAVARPEGFRLDLNFEPDDSQSQRGLLRGVAFEYLGNGKRPIRLTAVPPIGATANLSNIGRQIPLIFGRVLSLAPGLDIRPQYSDLLWNGNPYGSWRVSCDGDLSRYGIEDIAMHVWLAY